MRPLKYYKSLLSVVIFYDYAYDNRRTSSFFSSDLSRTKLFLRFLNLFVVVPISLLAWILLRTLSIRYKVSIYILKPFRPGFASTYLCMIEPLCRQLQREDNTRHIKILVDPGESVSSVLVNSYEPHFTMYFDDRRKFLRLIAYLIPRLGFDKQIITGSNKFLDSWLHLPSKNYANLRNRMPSDLAALGIEKENYVLFAHGSKTYYQNRYDPTLFSNLQYQFYDLSAYAQALNIILEKNLKVVRVGIQVDELPKTLKALQFVDYTGEVRKEESELWLYENCKFLLSASNGAWWFARRFDRPTLITNNYVLIAGYLSTLYTPMTIRTKEFGNTLSFAEMLKLRATPDFLSNKFMQENGIEFIPNSDRTIANAVDDILNLINGAISSTPEDSELMNRYQALLTSFDIPIAEKMTVPTISFLREHRHLL